MTKSKYNKQITLKKGLKQFVLGAVSVISAGLVAVYGNNPTYIALAPFINGALEMLTNWAKHKDD